MTKSYIQLQLKAIGGYKRFTNQPITDELDGHLVQWLNKLRCGEHRGIFSTVYLSHLKSSLAYIKIIYNHIHINIPKAWDRLCLAQKQHPKNGGKLWGLPRFMLHRTTDRTSGPGRRSPGPKMAIFPPTKTWR